MSRPIPDTDALGLALLPVDKVDTVRAYDEKVDKKVFFRDAGARDPIGSLYKGSGKEFSSEFMKSIADRTKALKIAAKAAGTSSKLMPPPPPPPLDPRLEVGAHCNNLRYTPHRLCVIAEVSPARPPSGSDSKIRQYKVVTGGSGSGRWAARDELEFVRSKADAKIKEEEDAKEAVRREEQLERERQREEAEREEAERKEAPQGDCAQGG